MNKRLNMMMKMASVCVLFTFMWNQLSFAGSISLIREYDVAIKMGRSYSIEQTKAFKESDESHIEKRAYFQRKRANQSKDAHGNTTTIERTKTQLMNNMEYNKSTSSKAAKELRQQIIRARNLTQGKPKAPKQNTSDDLSQDASIPEEALDGNPADLVNDNPTNPVSDDNTTDPVDSNPTNPVSDNPTDPVSDNPTDPVDDGSGSFSAIDLPAVSLPSPGTNPYTIGIINPGYDVDNYTDTGSDRFNNPSIGDVLPLELASNLDPEFIEFHDDDNIMVYMGRDFQNGDPVYENISVSSYIEIFGKVPDTRDYGLNLLGGDYPAVVFSPNTVDLEFSGLNSDAVSVEYEDEVRDSSGKIIAVIQKAYDSSRGLIAATYISDIIYSNNGDIIDYRSETIIPGASPEQLCIPNTIPNAARVEYANKIKDQFGRIIAVTQKAYDDSDTLIAITDIMDIRYNSYGAVECYKLITTVPGSNANNLELSNIIPNTARVEYANEIKDQFGRIIAVTQKAYDDSDTLISTTDITDIEYDNTGNIAGYNHAPAALKSDSVENAYSIALAFAFSDYVTSREAAEIDYEVARSSALDSYNATVSTATDIYLSKKTTAWNEYWSEWKEADERYQAVLDDIYYTYELASYSAQTQAERTTVLDNYASDNLDAWRDFCAEINTSSNTYRDKLKAALDEYQSAKKDAGQTYGVILTTGLDDYNAVITAASDIYHNETEAALNEYEKIWNDAKDAYEAEEDEIERNYSIAMDNAITDEGRRMLHEQLNNAKDENWRTFREKVQIAYDAYCNRVDTAANDYINAKEAAWTDYNNATAASNNTYSVELTDALDEYRNELADAYDIYEAVVEDAKENRDSDSDTILPHHKEYHDNNGKTYRRDIFESDGTTLRCTIYYNTDTAQTYTHKIVNYKNGRLYAETEFNKNDRLKTRSRYYENGNLYYHLESYENNQLETRSHYYEDGRLKSKIEYYENGTCKNYLSNEDATYKTYRSYYSDGKIKEQGYYYKNGQLHRSYEYYENGNCKNRHTYFQDGQLKEKAEYYENGSGKDYLLYYEDGTTKQDVKFYENGNKERDCNYMKNGSICYSREYYEDGFLKTKESYYENGMLHYSYEYWQNRKVSSNARIRYGSQYYRNGMCKNYTVREDEDGRRSCYLNQPFGWEANPDNYSFDNLIPDAARVEYTDIVKDGHRKIISMIQLAYNAQDDLIATTPITDIEYYSALIASSWDNLVTFPISDPADLDLGNIIPDASGK